MKANKYTSPYIKEGNYLTVTGERHKANGYRFGKGTVNG
jgi:hypothetical protein